MWEASCHHGWEAEGKVGRVEDNIYSSWVYLHNPFPSTQGISYFPLPPNISATLRMYLWTGRSIETPIDLVRVIITLSYPKLPPLNVTLWRIKPSGMYGAPWVISNTNHDNYRYIYVSLKLVFHNFGCICVSTCHPLSQIHMHILFSDMTELYFLSLTNFLSFF